MSFPIASARRLPLAAALLVLAGCQGFEPSPLPAGAEPLVAPVEYRAWWDRTEGCSGLSGRFEGIQWYVVPGATSLATELGERVALWVKSDQGTRIIVAGAWVEDELVVRHEMLHELLSREGHPDQYFRERCKLTWDTFASGDRTNGGAL